MTKVVLGGLLLVLAGATQRNAVTPVERVISLLTKLSAQVQAEGVAEAASYDKYACFCKEHADSKQYEIAKSDEKIKNLDAEISSLSSEITQLDDDVSKSKKEVTQEEKIMDDNQKARTKDQKEYETERKELFDAVKAVENALESMRQSRDDVKEVVTSLLQKLPAQSLALALAADATAVDPAGPAYKYKSKDVIGALQKLVVKFKKDLADLDEAEILTQNAFGMTRGARLNTVKALKKDISEKETLSASKGEKKSDLEQVKADETDARNADQGFLDDLLQKCQDKAKAWDQRSTTRATEITALIQAVELLKGMGDAYNANAKLVGLVAIGSRPSFFQTQSIRRDTSKTQLQWLTDYFKAKAHSLKSTPLALLAFQIKVGGPDHFVKVRGLIKDLIKKLKDDAKAEATAKGICDMEMKSAIDQRDKQTAKVETSAAQIESTTADINALKDDITALSESIAELNKQLLEMAELRAKEKAENDKTVANADSGKAAVDQAISLLKKFYGSALIQRHNVAASFTPKDSDRDGKTVDDYAPKTFDSSEKYKGKTSASKGIVGMLEVISSDFERTSKTVTKAEADAVKDYEMLKADTEQDIKDKEKLKKAKETDLDSKKLDLILFKDDLKTAEKMKEEALEELEKLKASCVDSGETWEERAKHRKEEIEALKEALQILEDWKS